MLITGIYTIGQKHVCTKNMDRIEGGEVQRVKEIMLGEYQ
jgi:hypothetical protein